MPAFKFHEVGEKRRDLESGSKGVVSARCGFVCDFGLFPEALHDQIISSMIREHGLFHFI